VFTDIRAAAIAADDDTLPLNTMLQSRAIAIAIAKTVIFWSCYFFPSTDFSSSLGRFSRNFATRRGMS